MNATINGSGCTIWFNPTAETIGRTVVLCLILVCSVVGNVLIGVIVYKEKSMRKPINYFIVNMGMSDLIFAILVFARDLTESYMDARPISGPLGQGLCKLFACFIFISFMVSVQSLVLIAVDRFGAVVFPLRFPLINTKLCPFFVVVSWLIAVALDSPYLIAVRVVENSGKLSCQYRWNEVFGESFSEKDFFIGFSFVFLYIPITLLTILYSIILYKLKSQKIPGEQAVNAQEPRRKRNRNVVKMAIAIVLVFFICWLPYNTVWLLKNFQWDGELPCGILPYRHIFTFLCFANCAINPFICFIFSSNYRQGFKKRLRCFSAMRE